MINLGNVVLMLKARGVKDLIHFDFLYPPPHESLVQCKLLQLYALGAFNHSGDLTKLGGHMAEFPFDLMMTKKLLASEKFKCSEEAATIREISVNIAIFYRSKYKLILTATVR